MQTGSASGVINEGIKVHTHQNFGIATRITNVILSDVQFNPMDCAQRRRIVLGRRMLGWLLRLIEKFES